MVQFAFLPMLNRKWFSYLALGWVISLGMCGGARAQQYLSLKQALQVTAEQYGLIKAKKSYAQGAQESIHSARREFLPNLNLVAQQDYGTVNGQNGPLYGFGGFAVASSGLPLSRQSWNAAFGSLYLANVNWDVFTFGRKEERIKTAQSMALREQRDYEQEIFQQQVKVAGAYLNLLAAKSLRKSWEKNLSRADAFSTLVKTRARNQLIPGVDSSQANAEVSNAHISLTKARDFEQEQENRLAQLMGIPPQRFELDTLFLIKVPQTTQTDSGKVEAHPVLKWYESRIQVSDQQARYLNRLKYPTVSLVGIVQTRGSGFNSNYAQDQNSFTGNYFTGIAPSRTNYLIGAAISWNVTQLSRIAPQVRTQQFQSKGLKEEYDLSNQILHSQLLLSENKLSNAYTNYREVPFQLKAASDAYTQRSVLYRNGLTNLVDVTQALYALVRAETDRDLAYANVWQALLLKAAALGDLNVFTQEF